MVFICYDPAYPVILRMDGFWEFTYEDLCSYVDFKTWNFICDIL